MEGIYWPLMNSNFISWNMRGLLSEVKARGLRRVIRKFKQLIVAIHKTKKEIFWDILISFL